MMNTRKYQIILMLFLMPGILGAQVIEQLSPEEKKQLTKVTEPITLYKGFLRAGLSASYYGFDKVFDSDGKKTSQESSISGYGLATIFSLHYGITDRLEMETLLPYLMLRNSISYTYEIPFTEEVGTEYFKSKSHGLGDVLTMLRYQVVQDRHSSLSLTVGLGVNVPTGKNEVTEYKNPREFNSALAKGEWGIFPEVKIRKVMYPFSFEFGAGAFKYFGDDKVLQANADPVRVVSGSELVISPKVNFHLNEWVSFSNNFEYYHALKDDFEGEDQFGNHNNEFNQWLFRYSPIITFQVKRLRLEQAVYIPLAGQTVTAEPSYYLIVQYMF
jgi:hypothetical protein